MPTSPLPLWQRELAEAVRRLAHQADPDVEETIKRRTLPYFVLEGNICALLGAKDHLNVFIYDPIAPDPTGLINQGQGNATARGIQIRRGDDSTRQRWSRCFERSLRTTGPVVGARSRHSSKETTSGPVDSRCRRGRALRGRGRLRRRLPVEGRQQRDREYAGFRIRHVGGDAGEVGGPSTAATSWGGRRAGGVAPFSQRRPPAWPSLTPASPVPRAL